jgi:hypothetical protein
VASRLLLLAFAFACVDAAPYLASVQGVGNDSVRIAEADAFRQLKNAVKADDRHAVALAFVYPLRVNRTAKESFSIRAPAELLGRYDEILTPHVRQAILAQQSDSLFYSWRGAMVGNGEVWISGICEPRDTTKCRVGVTSINLGGSPGAHDVGAGMAVSVPTVAGRLTAGFYAPGQPSPNEKFAFGFVRRSGNGYLSAECANTGAVIRTDSAGRFVLPRTTLSGPDSMKRTGVAVCLDIDARARRALWYAVQVIQDSAWVARDTLWLDCLWHGAAGSSDCVVVRKDALSRPPIPRQ